MPMLSDPSTKYLPYPAVPFAEGYVRQWPNKRAVVAPTWLSTDLRDGNQALVNPMSNKTKLGLFRLLVKIGFKEIEVAYPAASDQEYDFVRSLIENNEVPDDVSLQIITPARPDLIARSIASLAGSKKAIIHLYNAVSPIFRDVVFRNTQEKTTDLTLAAVRLVKKLTQEETARSGTHFRLNYCLETFSQTEPEFATELATRVLQEWGNAGPGDDRVTFNLAATVECAPANHYADQVEYFHNHMVSLNQRDNVILSIHPHNDRGTAVAATELALLAGGDRVEGCLLGNGERTGNVDLVTLALNLYSQGVSPCLDFSDLPAIVSEVCRCNETQVPVRYPYTGSLVFSAFAGTHQDAIAKGLEAQQRRWDAADQAGSDKKYWQMPYVPLDPKDLGYGYENLIRVSSQSGKAGAAFIVRQQLGLQLPRQMQPTFYKIVQRDAEMSGKEMTPALVERSFRRAFHLASKPATETRVFLQAFQLFPLSADTQESASPFSEFSDDLSVLDTGADGVDTLRFTGTFRVDGQERSLSGDGPGPVSALLAALREHLALELDVTNFSSQTLSGSRAACFVELEQGAWGVGVSSDAAAAKLRAVVSAANAAAGERAFPKAKPVFTHRFSSGGEAIAWEDIAMRAGRGVERRDDGRGEVEVVV